MDRTFDCTKCGTTHSFLEEFPGGVCLKCWAMSPQGRYVPTADELVQMWGGPATR